MAAVDAARSERISFQWNRDTLYLILSCACPGKPVSTFPGHALAGERHLLGAALGDLLDLVLQIVRLEGLGEIAVGAG